MNNKSFVCSKSLKTEAEDWSQ